MPRRFVLTLAWIQLLVSFAIAAGIIFTYPNFGPAIRDGARSAAGTVAGVADVTQHASETVESMRVLVKQASEVLANAALQIDQVQALASGQAKVAPHYVEGLRSASGLLVIVGDTSQAIADGMNFPVPTGITWRGATPSVTMARPFDGPARKLAEVAVQAKGVGKALSTAAESVASGAPTINKAILETSQTSRELIRQLETTIQGVSSKDLPDAVNDLRTISLNVRSLSETIDGAQGLGIWLLVGGLLLSLWCVLNSLTTIGLVSVLSRNLVAGDGATS